MWTGVNFANNERELTQEELLQFQIALNRRLAHALSHIRNNQILNIEANKITTKEAFITVAQIEQLIVGDNVTMGENASISWEQVTNKPEIGDGYTDQDVLDLIQGTYIDGESVWTINVYAQNITAGFLKLVEGMKIGTEDETVEIDKDGIRIVGGKISIKGDNTETIIDGFGINPKFLDYSKNVIWNSSFEVIDANNKPSFWNIDGDGASVSSSSFYGTRSLRLGTGALARQTWAARTKPWWINKEQVRVSFYARGVKNIKVRVVDIGTWQDTGGIFVGYYLLTDNDGNNGVTGIGTGNGGSELTFSGSANWEDSRIEFTFNSGQYASDPITNDITAFALEIENVDTGDIFIDGVMAHIDFTKQWSQLYKDGPRSVSLQQIGNFFTNPDPLEASEAQFLDGVPLTDLKLYDNGMILTLLDGTITKYVFTLDDDGNIIKLTNQTTGIETVIDDVGGNMP
jgi:hypothetical protein